MPELTNTSEILLARLAEGLDATAKMTQALLSDLRESETDFAAMKTELNILKENVHGLSELVRDGGTSSILTRVALIEQNIENIKKWMDDHVDVHQRLKGEFSEIQEKFSEIERRLFSVEDTLREIEDETKEAERERRDSITREMDLVYEKQKADQKVRAEKESADEKVRAEKQSAIVKIVSAIAMGIVGLATGYFVKSCTEIAGKANLSAEPTKAAITQSQPQIRPPPPLPQPSPGASGSSQTP